jgi:hypothetical protein
VVVGRSLFTLGSAALAALCLGGALMARAAECVRIPDWTARYDGPENDGDHPTQVALDAGGNVVVAGLTRTYYGQNLGTPAVVKYDDAGRRLWKANLLPIRPDDYVAPPLLRVAADGDIYVLVDDGLVNEVGQARLFRFSPKGERRWVCTIESGFDDIRHWAPGDLLVRDDGSVVLAGSRNLVDYDLSRPVWWRTEIDAGGHVVGDVQGQSNETFFSFRIAALRIAADGDVCLSGTASAANGVASDVWTAKVAPDGNPRWEKWFAGASRGTDTAADLRVDPQNNVFVAVISYAGGRLEDLALVKYSSDGRQLWLRSYDSRDHLSDRPWRLSVAPDGGVCVVGGSYAEENAGGWLRESFIAKYSAAGKPVWGSVLADDFGGLIENYFNFPCDLAATADGGAVVLGSESGIRSGNPLAPLPLLRLDRLGVAVWSASLPLGAGEFQAGNASPKELAVDDGGTVVAAYASFGKASGRDWTIAAFPAAPAVASLRLAKKSVKGGAPVNATVTLTAAPAQAGYCVRLISADPQLVQAPAMVAFKAGSRKARVVIRTKQVRKTTRVRLSAEADGVVRPATLTLTR